MRMNKNFNNSVKVFFGATVLGMLTPILSFYVNSAFGTSAGIGSAFLLVLSAYLATEELEND